MFKVAQIINWGTKLLLIWASSDVCQIELDRWQIFCFLPAYVSCHDVFSTWIQFYFDERWPAAKLNPWGIWCLAPSSVFGSWSDVVLCLKCLLSLRALTPMAGPSAALNRCVTCSVACPLSAAVLECYLCRGHLCRACLFRGVCLCAGCVQTLNPLLLRVPTMDLFFYNRSDELLEQTRWVVELADALTECHICRSVGFFVSCSGCHKPTCVGCHQTPETQCNWCCVEDFKLEFVGY